MKARRILSYPVVLLACWLGMLYSGRCLWADKGIFLQSESIRPVEMGEGRAVFESTLDPKNTGVGKLKEERAIVALPESDRYDVKMLEAEYASAGPEKVTVWRAGDEADEFPDGTEDFIEVKALGFCRDLHLARISVKFRAHRSEKRAREVREYCRLRFEISFVPTNKGDGPDFQDPGFGAMFSKILANPDFPDDWRVSQAEIPAPTREDIPKDSTGPYYRVLLEGKGFFSLPLDGLPEGLSRTDFAVVDRGKSIPFALQDGGIEGKESIVLYSEDDSVFSATNAVWLVPVAEGVRALQLCNIGPVGEKKGLDRAFYTDFYEEDRVFKDVEIKGDMSERQAGNWMWATFGVYDDTDPKGGEPSAFEWDVPLTDLAVDAATMEFKVGIAASESNGLKPVSPHNCRMIVAGHEIPYASNAVNFPKLDPSRCTFSFIVEVNDEILEKARSSGCVGFRAEVRRPPNEEGETSPCFLDRISVAYLHQPALRNGEMRLPLSCGNGPWEIRVPEGDVESVLQRAPWAFLMGERDPIALLDVGVRKDGRSIVVAGAPDEGLSEAREIRVILPEKIKTAFSIQERGIDRLLSTKMGADGIFIVHPPFYEEVLPLARLHESNGQRVEVVTTEEIYDVFGDGTTSPKSIKKFLAYAYRNWVHPPPSTVVLVGDASWDYKGRFGNGILNQVPAYREPGRPDRDGTYANDHWYACVEGDDLLPEMHVGRIAVNGPETCRAAVKKIVDGCAPKGPWRARVLVFSDKEREFNEEAAEILRSGTIPFDYNRRWMKLKDYTFEDNYYIPENKMREGEKKHSPAGNEALRAELNKGAFFWDYFGHGAPNVLGHQRILFGGGSKYTDVKKMTNGRKYPFFIGNTCDTARFDYAEEKWNVCLGEDLLQYPDGGCIAMILHTGRGFPSDHRVIDRMFQQAMFRFGLRTAGEIDTAGKILYLLSDNEPEPVKMMVLIGDPSTVIPVPEKTLTVKVRPESFIQGREAGLRATVEAEPADDAVKAVMETGKYRAYIYCSDSESNIVWESDVSIEGSHGYAGEVDLSGSLPIGPGRVGVYLYPDPEAGTPDLPDAVGSATFEVCVDAERLKTLENGVKMGGLPNAAIAGISTEPKDPVNGETIWICVDVVNNGTGTARNLGIAAYHNKIDETRRIGARVEENEKQKETLWTVDTLYPSEKKSVTLRWDPFDNAGKSKIVVMADPSGRIAESNENDNSATAEITVRRKGDLSISKESVAFRRDEPTQKVLMRAVVENTGESDIEQEFIVSVDAYKTDDPDEKPEPFVVEFFKDNGLIPFPPAVGKGREIMLKDLPWDTKRVVMTIDKEKIISEETRTNDRIEVQVEEHLR